MLSRDQSDACLPAAYMKVAGLKTERPVLYVLMAGGGGGIWKFKLGKKREEGIK
jgi:hypothetical protein